VIALFTVQEFTVHEFKVFVLEVSVTIINLIKYHPNLQLGITCHSGRKCL